MNSAGDANQVGGCKRRIKERSKMAAFDRLLNNAYRLIEGDDKSGCVYFWSRKGRIRPMSTFDLGPIIIKAAK